MDLLRRQAQRSSAPPGRAWPHQRTNTAVQTTPAAISAVQIRSLEFCSHQVWSMRVAVFIAFSSTVAAVARHRFIAPRLCNCSGADKRCEFRPELVDDKEDDHRYCNEQRLYAGP